MFRPGQLIYLVCKRILDILFGLIGTVMLIPVSAVIKAAYLLSGDKAGIFYMQKRVGQNGKYIRIYKYRTMVPDADKKLAELLQNEKYRAEWEANQKLTNDPRITKVGRLLRKSSVDELPQVLNLLRADMSLVGPRPLVEGELERTAVCSSISASSLASWVGGRATADRILITGNGSNWSIIISNIFRCIWIFSASSALCWPFSKKTAQNEYNPPFGKVSPAKGGFH